MVKKELYPFAGHFLDINGLKYHYLDEGTGEPVVMLHGNPTWSFYFRNLVSELRGDYRVIAPDHIGCGLSDKPGDDRYSYTLKRRVADLYTLLDSLGVVSGITLVLHDWGGMIGAGYAVRYPERIKRLVLMNTCGFHLPEKKPFPFPLWVARNTPLGPLLICGFNGFARLASFICPKRPLPPHVREAYLAPYNSWRNRIATLRFVQDIPLKSGDTSYDLVTNIQNNLYRLRVCKVMLLWGMKDFVFDKHFLDKWLKYFPDAETHRFENGGHYIIEDYGPKCAGHIKAFLAKHR